MLKALRLRPLCAACFFFIAISAVAIFLPFSAKVAGMGGCVILFFTFLFLPGLRVRLPLFAISLLLVFGAGAFLLSVLQRDMPQNQIPEIADKQVPVEGVVRSVEMPTTSLSVVTLDLRTVDGKPTSLRASLPIYGETTLQVGNLIRADLLLSQAESAFDGSFLGSGSDVALAAELPEAGTIDVSGTLGGIYGFYALLQRIRCAFVNLTGYLFRRDSASFLSALLFGQRDGLEGSVTQNFRALGISHVLAISGMHLSVLLGLVQLLLRRILSPRAAAPVLIVLTWLFAAMIAFPVSIVRAAVMMTFVQLSNLLQRDSDPLTSLSAAGALIVAFSPGALTDLSFLLSFFAVLGLCVLSKPLGQAIRSRFSGGGVRQRMLRYLLTALSASFSALLFTLPVLFFSYGSVSALSLPMSLLFLPPVTLLLTVTPLTLLLCRVPFLGIFLVHLTDEFTGLILEAAQFFARSCSLMLPLRRIFVIPIVIAALVCTFIILKKKKRLFLRFSLLFFTVTALYFSCLVITDFCQRNTYDIHYISNGKQDALTVGNTSFRLLCDISDGKYSTFSLAANCLENGSGINDIDVLLFMHYSVGHVNSFARLAAFHRVKTICLPTPKGKEEAAICRNLEDIAVEYGCTVLYVDTSAKATLTFEGVTITFFCGSTETPLVTLALEIGNTRILYAENGVFETEQAVFFSLFDSADYLICGAHGSARGKDIFPQDILENVDGLVCTSETVLSHLHTTLPVYTEALHWKVEGTIPNSWQK